jgi:hypothetical protein
MTLYSYKDSRPFATQDSESRTVGQLRKRMIVVIRKRTDYHFGIEKLVQRNQEWD